MGEEKSKLLQVTHTTVLKVIILSPSPCFSSAARTDLLCHPAGVPWAIQLVLLILTVLWDLLPLKHGESWLLLWKHKDNRRMIQLLQEHYSPLLKLFSFILKDLTTH